MNALSDPSLLVLSAVTVTVSLAIGMEVRRRRKFNDRWPPISDDEFVARCSDGVSRDTALRVRRIVAEQLGVPYERVYPEQDFVRDLDC